MTDQTETLPLLPEPEPVAVLPPSDWLDMLPTEADCLRDLQRAVLAETAVEMRQHRRILVQAACGFGKTHLMAAITAAALTYAMVGLRVLILATRTRLVRQIHERLDAFGVRHGILAAGMPGYTAWSSAVQVASVDTLYRRCLANKRMPLPSADVVMFDEAHLALGASRQAILNGYPMARVFGFTATPAKTSGATLRDQFDKLILGPPIAQLVQLGQLVPPRIFDKPVLTKQELRAVPKDSKTGDYANGALGKAMSRPKLVGDVVSNWLRIANGKRTFVFACNKSHGADLLREFLQAGVAAEMLTDSDEETAREDTIRRLESGHTLVVINCFLLSYGIDVPSLECVVLARATRSVVLYLQAVWRAGRPSPGKQYFILIDHGRVVESLGSPTYDREWSIDGCNVNQAALEDMAEREKSPNEQPRKCRECECLWAVSENGPCCPNCGWQPLPSARAVATLAADLEEAQPEIMPRQEMGVFFREAIRWYADRWPDRWKDNEKKGRWWAWMKTREKFKRPADERMPYEFNYDTMAEEVSNKVSGYLKSGMIRYAKRQEKAQRERQVSL